MSIFGLPTNEFVYYVFLPFLLFYVILYALLKKSQILGNSNTLNALASISISALAVISLYQLNLIKYSIWISTFLVLASFFVLFGFGTLSYSSKKIDSFISGEQFKTKEEKNYETAKEKADELYKKFSQATNDKEKLEYLTQLSQLIPELEKYASILGKDVSVELPWISAIKELIKRIKESKERSEEI